MIEINNLETERLYLTKTKEEERKELENILSYKEVNKYYKNKNNPNYEFTIKLKDIDEIIGKINIIIDKELNADIDFYIDTLYQRKGYCYEALLEVIKYLFLEIKVKIIKVNILKKDNITPKLLEKIGFNKNNNTKEEYEYILEKTIFLKEYFRREKLYIEKSIDKEPYIKHISDNQVLNITGIPYSGKTTFLKEFLIDINYIIIDTKLLINNKIPLDLYNYLIKKYKNIDMVSNFDKIYIELLNYYKDSNKLIIIESNYYSNIKDINILKGDIIILRTCINNCNRNYLNSNSFKDIIKSNEIDFYNDWYKMNSFLNKIDRIK